MRERGRHPARDVDLPDPVPALPGEQCVAFDEAQRIPHRRVVSEVDLRSGVGVGALPV